MTETIDELISLLHERPYGVLASQSKAMPGYPFASVLPYVPDEAHRPVFFISRLAEHTRNLQQDSRASLLLFEGDGPDVLAGPRATWLGDVVPVPSGEALRRRWLRYNPDAAQYIDFADFGFYRLRAERVRFVAGFGQMGWIQAGELEDRAILPPEDEENLLTALAGAIPDGVEIAGLDAYGVDYRRAGRRLRHRFPGAPLAPAELEPILRAWLAGHCGY
ncbi:HugZ family protein [Methylococcus sp. EFPC2]|uniref:HugZ family pyridoxamine 5'-phosphate oxidase n=1 Tax=Methylococcus sp. EFPC2 TaxID=2812648 RepID=UPI0019680DF8|nr:pyridoxamine 5'-phosphate oxidase family protein [Methylococcus sp. EFPC2]QSA98590.1 pyridoxamine 5'-phosphate oxidase family protein [Methylococcus sp. EFPC2]